MQSTPVKYILGPDTKWAFVNVSKPVSSGEYGVGKYAITLLIDKGSDEIGKISKVLKEIYEANKAMFVKDGKQLTLKELHLPVLDGDEKRPDNPDFSNKYFINAQSKYKPEVVDEALNPVDPASVHSGDCGRVSLQLFAYNVDDGAAGIGCRLNNLQRISVAETKNTDFATAKDDFAEFVKKDVVASSDVDSTYVTDEEIPF